MKELIEKMQKAINKELDEAKGQLRVATYKFKNATLANEIALYRVEIEQIKERIATLCYLSAICHE